MLKIEIKPLSVNQAWKGRRFKTPEYRKYEKAVFLTLPKMEIPQGKLSVVYEFGFSNKLADWDNPIKPFQDILQKKYGFNDSRIVSATVIKTVVKKGQEYISFDIKAYNKKARELSKELSI